jgi:hypothetical protein
MSGAPWPCYYRWDGDVMVPMARFKHRCDDQFIIDQVYRLVQEEERSAATHRHFFACLSEGWKNLSDDLAARFPTPESLRHWCLIKSGYADENSIVFDTAKDAKTVAAFIGRMDEYAVVMVSGNVVRRYTAQSQSVRAMDKKTFQESKQAVLELVASMIGVTAAALASEVKKQGFHDEPEEEPAEPAPPHLAHVVADGGAIIDSAPPTTETPPPATPTKAEPEKRATGRHKAPDRPPSKAAVKAAADRAEKASAAQRDAQDEGFRRAQEAEAAKPKAKSDLKTADDYVAYARAWIAAATSYPIAQEQFDQEHEIRRRLKVPIKAGAELQSAIEHKFEATS